jgi:L-fucose mutarotase
MLKGISPLLVPELLATMAQMGHGDLLAVVDRNFPAHSTGTRVIDLPAVDATQVLEAVLRLLPVDEYQDPAAWHMLTDDGRPGPAAAEVGRTLDATTGIHVPYQGLPRPEFYVRAREAYCTIRTGDARPYACFLVAKGVVADQLG